MIKSGWVFLVFIKCFVNLLVKVVLLVFCNFVIIIIVGIFGDLFSLIVFEFNVFVNFLLIIFIICWVGDKFFNILIFIVCFLICFVKFLIICKLMLVFNKVKWIFCIIFFMLVLEIFFLWWILFIVCCRWFVKFLKVIVLFFYFLNLFNIFFDFIIFGISFLNILL